MGTASCELAVTLAPCMQALFKAFREVVLSGAADDEKCVAA